MAVSVRVRRKRYKMASTYRDGLTDIGDRFVGNLLARWNDGTYGAVKIMTD